MPIILTPVLLAGTGARGYVDGAAGVAEFHSPLGMDISLDASALFVCDVGNGAVRRLAMTLDGPLGGHIGWLRGRSATLGGTSASGRVRRPERRGEPRA